MKWYLFIVLAGYFYIIISCADEKVQNVCIDQTLAFDVTHVDTLLCKTVERINFLALDTAENSYVHGVDKMVIKNNLIFIGDFHTGKIVVYDMNGKVKFVLDRKGAGPQEYLELKSFAVDEQNIYTLDNLRHNVNIYDCQTGVFKQSQKLSFVAWDMEILDNDHFIFAFIPMKGGQLHYKQPPYKIFITDKDLEITNKYFKYEQDEYEFIGRTTYFTSMKSGVVFSSMNSDTYTLFSTRDSLKHIAVDFADKIPDKYRLDRNKILEGEYNFISQTPILCKDYVAFEFSVGDNLISYIYDEKVGCFFSNTYVSSYNYLFHPITSYQNQLVSYLDDYSLYKEVADTGFSKASAVIEHHLKNEGAMLIFYQMR